MQQIYLNDDLLAKLSKMWLYKFVEYYLYYLRHVTSIVSQDYLQVLRILSDYEDSHVIELEI